MTQTVGELDFPFHGFLESRRGPIVEIALSNSPGGLARTYVLVPEGAGELPPGIYSTMLKQVVDLDERGGWMVEVDLEPEPRGAEVRLDTTLDDEWESDERDLLIASHAERFQPQEPPAEREGDQPVNPYGLWALDESGSAFRVEVERDEESGGLLIEAATRFGKALHPWAYGAVRADTLEIEEHALEGDDALLDLQLYVADGDDDREYERWLVGTRRALEARAASPLPEFDPGQWMRWLTPVDGGAPVAFGGFLFPEKREIELQPVMPKEPAWATGRLLTIPRERPDQAFEGSREVTVYGKPFKELRSSVAKVRKRPATPIGRFVLQAEGYMPERWSLLG
ncbi:hypothetical protein [Agrococcus jenensis]|uniref:Uncharacterized protein n=1 Tax=Agrococcus jenensis TaxID=46353 RepID=A0A3N2AS97_9MICO|nr:hypothetical protein [Agrococcus jenensis]ROR65919.1 hypothetical protein EDD26_1290 [Agrococcus jenensis]